MTVHLEAVGLSATTRVSWTFEDCMLYAASLNCGTPELPFVTENSQGVEPRVLPTFVTLMMDLASKRGPLPQKAWWDEGAFGDFGEDAALDGGRTITLFRELPTAASVDIVTTVTGIWDKGSGAVIEFIEVGRDVSTGEHLWEHEMWGFVRGQGGWGGEPGPERLRHDPPAREPDIVVSYDTYPNQTYLYRLNGDRAAFHSDPLAAQAAGFSRPFMHGLCTYGFTGRAVLEGLCGGQPDRFGSMTGRFSAPAYPGDTLVIKMWQDGGGAIYRTENQDGVVLIDRGRADLAPLALQ